MTDLLFWTFLALIIVPLLKLLRRPELIYRFPFFMVALFAIFILPQAVSLLRFPGAAPEPAVQNVLLLTCLCVVACLIGYRFSFSLIIVSQTSRPLDRRRLLHAGLLFVCSGLLFSFLLSHTEVQTTEFGGWTGTATIYGFFQQLCYPGFAICLLLALDRPSASTVAAALISAVVPLQSIAFGRREAAALVLLTIGLTLYFRCRLRPARWLVVGLILGAMLGIPATGTYRRLQLQKDWESIKAMDLVGNFKEFLNQESVLELRNAAMLIEATRQSGDYEYGAGYWNHLIFRYVPAQILGEAFKEALMIQRPHEGLERELAAMDYVNPTGSTVTAMGDSFQQFGFFGCVFFVGLGMFFRGLWRAAVQREALFAQLLYMQSCTAAMRALTHWTLDFLPGLLYNVLFLGAAVYYASVPKTGGCERRLAQSPAKQASASPPAPNASRVLSP